MEKEKAALTVELATLRVGSEGQGHHEDPKRASDGRARKAHNIASDPSTDEKVRGPVPGSHNVEMPLVNKVECQLVRTDADSGEDQLLMESAETDVCQDR